jgi:hypothetical protein
MDCWIEENEERLAGARQRQPLVPGVISRQEARERLLVGRGFARMSSKYREVSSLAIDEDARMAVPFNPTSAGEFEARAQ